MPIDRPRVDQRRWILADRGGAHALAGFAGSSAMANVDVQPC
jgi:hypothetical protein